MNTLPAIFAFDDMDRMAQAIAKSGLFGMKTTEQALALMIVAQSENRHPGSVAAEYHIIQGRPALKADAMLARFQLAGGLVEWVEYTDKKVAGKFSHSVNSPTPVLIEWTIEMAQKAGLAGKDNWKNYPRQMLRARVVSEGVRTVYPAVCVGVYTPEEVQDFESAEKPGRGAKAKNMGAAEVVPQKQPLAANSSHAESSPSSAAAGAAAGVKMRSDTLRELCLATGGKNSVIQICERAGVAHPDELSEDDYAEACAMLKRKAAKATA